ncbi:MerR family transcriptional regulator [Streptomyces sp. NPDC052225]|uniref:MerR family transcriptional regulator n=1 Tax=Streptomyces sp. NPDC052225 TaxID=3154949 RepID=UPI00342BD1E0
MQDLSELSERAGIPERMLRFYVRMELLPDLPAYDESHVRRVAFVRALLDVGGLSHAAIRQLLRRVDTSEPTFGELLGAVQYALPARGSTAQDQEWERARGRAEEFAAQRQWRVGADNPAWQTLTQVLVACEWLRQHDLLDLLGAYADALERLVAVEVELLRRKGDPETAATSMVSGTVLGDIALCALRRLLHEHFSRSVDDAAKFEEFMEQAESTADSAESPKARRREK